MKAAPLAVQALALLGPGTVKAISDFAATNTTERILAETERANRQYGFNNVLRVFGQRVLSHDEPEVVENTLIAEAYLLRKVFNGQYMSYAYDAEAIVRFALGTMWAESQQPLPLEELASFEGPAPYGQVYVPKEGTDGSTSWFAKTLSFPGFKEVMPFPPDLGPGGLDPGSSHSLIQYFRGKALTELVEKILAHPDASGLKEATHLFNRYRTLLASFGTPGESAESVGHDVVEEVLWLADLGKMIRKGMVKRSFLEASAVRFVDEVYSAQAIVNALSDAQDSADAGKMLIGMVSKVRSRIGALPMANAKFSRRVSETGSFFRSLGRVISAPTRWLTQGVNAAASVVNNAVAQSTGVDLNLPRIADNALILNNVLSTAVDQGGRAGLNRLGEYLSRPEVAIAAGLGSGVALAPLLSRVVGDKLTKPPVSGDQNRAPISASQNASAPTATATSDVVNMLAPGLLLSNELADLKYKYRLASRIPAINER